VTLGLPSTQRTFPGWKRVYAVSFDLQFRRIGNEVNQVLAGLAPADGTHGPGTHSVGASGDADHPPMDPLTIAQSAWASTTIDAGTNAAGAQVATTAYTNE
jgi:hypothetical protein